MIYYNKFKPVFPTESSVGMRRHFTPLWYWFIIITLLASCGSSSNNTLPTIPAGDNPTPTIASGTPVASSAVTISYASYDYERDMYIALAKQFNDTHPNINVVIVSLDDATQLPADKSGNYPHQQLMSTKNRLARRWY